MNSQNTIQLPIVVIPAYQPNEGLIGVVDSLLQYPFEAIIVINDGSAPSHDLIFQELEKKERVIRLDHAVNLGKGHALKTAMNYALVKFPHAKGIVTVDADGQHLAKDVYRVARAFADNPNSLVLGSREFSKSVPLRSRFGNNLTKKVFAFFIGKKLQDTQTGLRGLPRTLIHKILRLKNNGYEFELDMLLLACHEGLQIREVTIETVYEPGNPTSHFNPILDSAKIYFVFFRFILSSLATALLDYFMFTISFLITGNILNSTIIARLVAGPVNFFFGKRLVFQSRNKPATEFVLYSTLVLMMLGVSYLAVDFFVTQLNVNVFFAKVLVEGLLFFFSFAVQRTLIFASKTQILVSEEPAEN